MSSRAPGVRNLANLDSGRVAPSRTAAIGGTLVARIAGRRLAAERDEDAHEEGDHDRARLEEQAAVGKSEADQVEEPEETFGQPEAEEQADDRGEHADDDRLEDDRFQDLPAGRSNRA